jgi:hypothetical protein
MKKLFAILGILCLFVSINLAYNLKQGASRATALNDKKVIFAAVDENTPPSCTWDVTLDENVLSEDKSKAIVIKATNKAEKECQSIISLHAPGFDISPSKEEQNVKLPTQAKGSLSWIITPRRTGTYELAISDIINTKVFGITVTNTFGLSTFQAKTFSIIGSLFGPMLTIPWWYERIRQRKPKPETPKEEN